MQCIVFFVRLLSVCSSKDHMYNIQRLLCIGMFIHITEIFWADIKHVSYNPDLNSLYICVNENSMENY